MRRQGPSASDQRPATAVCDDPKVLDAAVEVIEEFGYAGLTLARLADAAGTSRMTLHRRDTTLPAVVAGLSMRAAREMRDALFPILTADQPADQRLRGALEALCDVADRHLPLLAGLFSDDSGIFHAPPDETGALPTHEVFVAPFAKLLVDGAADGTLAPQDDAVEAATVLFNMFGWGYVQLRHAQHWPHQRAREGLLELVMTGLSQRR